MNQHRMLKEGGEQLAIIGIENWGGKGNFPKYGKLGQARQGTEAAPVKLLLSHDPSHWEAQVLPEFPDIDLMFAGHTHGMQFGVELPGLKWSPVQYMYKQWAACTKRRAATSTSTAATATWVFPAASASCPRSRLWS
jgi:predicted MPP superfamily phosphohydrolase